MKDLALKCPLDDADPVRSFRMARTIVVVETRGVADKKRHQEKACSRPGRAGRFGPEPPAITPLYALGVDCPCYERLGRRTADLNSGRGSAARSLRWGRIRFRAASHSNACVLCSPKREHGVKRTDNC